MCSRHAAEIFLLLRFYQILSYKIKEKIYTRFKQAYGFASQGFLVVRGNSWGFLWSGRHTRHWQGGGGVSTDT